MTMHKPIPIMMSSKKRKSQIFQFFLTKQQDFQHPERASIEANHTFGVILKQ